MSFRGGRVRRRAGGESFGGAWKRAYFIHSRGRLVVQNLVPSVLIEPKELGLHGGPGAVEVAGELLHVLEDLILVQLLELPHAVRGAGRPSTASTVRMKTTTRGARVVRGRRAEAAVIAPPGRLPSGSSNTTVVDLGSG